MGREYVTRFLRSLGLTSPPLNLHPPSDKRSCDGPRHNDGRPAISSHSSPNVAFCLAQSEDVHLLRNTSHAEDAVRITTPGSESGAGHFKARWCVIRCNRMLYLGGRWFKSRGRQSDFTTSDRHGPETPNNSRDWLTLLLQKCHE